MAKSTRRDDDTNTVANVSSPTRRSKKKKAVKTEDMDLPPPKTIGRQDDDDAAACAAMVAKSLPFLLKKHHKLALSVLFFCHHNGNRTLTYSELSADMEVCEKTKAWQCEAWKDLTTNKYIVVDSNHHAVKGKTKYKLSQEGIDLATVFASDEELATFRPAATNEEHHETIKSKLRKHPKGSTYGPKIFDVLLATMDSPPMTKHELAARLNTVADSHGFFYGFKALQVGGIIEYDGKRHRQDDGNGSTEAVDAIVNEQLEMAQKKKKFRSGGKLVKLVTEKVFLPSDN